MRRQGRGAAPHPAGRRAPGPALLLLASLGGCGFQPLYGHGADSPTADLPAIYVNNIGGRYGQLIRESLQQDLGSPDSGGSALYQLDVAPALSAAGIAVQSDNSTTFTREIGTANWTLRTVGLTPKTLASSSARTVDGYDNIDQQYFQGTVSGETTQTRIAANLADAITLQLATWFKHHNELQPHG